MFTFIETRLFTRLVQEYLSDDAYLELQSLLIERPDREPSPVDPVAYVSCDGKRLAAESAAGIV